VADKVRAVAAAAGNEAPLGDAAPAEKARSYPLMPDQLRPIAMQFGAPLGEREMDVTSNSAFWESMPGRRSIDQVAANLPDTKLLCQMVYAYGLMTLDQGQREIWRQRFEKFCG
jgi:hypothetical protein